MQHLFILIQHLLQFPDTGFRCLSPLSFLLGPLSFLLGLLSFLLGLLSFPFGILLFLLNALLNTLLNTPLLGFQHPLVIIQSSF